MRMDKIKDSGCVGEEVLLNLHTSVCQLDAGKALIHALMNMWLCWTPATQHFIEHGKPVDPLDTS